MDLLRNQKAAEPIDEIYQDLEDQLMQNIVRHLQSWDQPIASDKWLMQKLAEIGKLNKEHIKLIAKMSGIAVDEAENMLNVMAQEAIENIEPGFKTIVEQGLAGEAVEATKSKNVQHVMKTLMDQAKDALNVTNTTMLHKAQEAFAGLATNITDEALKIMNSNTAATITGAESRQQAMRRAISQFADKGITGFVDKAGREWSPEAYVNMCLRTTAGSVSEEVQTARCKDHDINLVAIDSHSGARPKCAKDQGKIFDMNNGSGETEDVYGKKIKYYPWNSSSYGEPDGLLGINCRHHKFPFIPGVNIQRYFPTEDMDANNKLYKETQVQRALERDVRKQKRECMMYKELKDDEAFEAAAVKLKGKEAKLQNYVDDHKELTRRKNREEVVGFDKEVSAKAVAANKKMQAQLTQSKPTKRPNKKELNMPSIKKTAGTKASENIKETRILEASKKLDSVLDKSKGEKRHIEQLKACKSDAVYRIKEDLKVPFSYSPKDDIIYYNPGAPFFDRYDLNYAQLHELTHRLDIKAYTAKNSVEFKAAIDEAKKYASENAEKIQELFTAGGKYYRDFAFSDIVSALSDNKIAVPVGHETWTDETVTLEIFANLSAIDVLEYESASEPLIADLLKGYRKVVNDETKD